MFLLESSSHVPPYSNVLFGFQTERSGVNFVCRNSSQLEHFSLSDVNVVCLHQEIAPELTALGRHIEERWTDVPKLTWWWKVRLSTTGSAREDTFHTMTVPKEKS
jgi:hypothetical protein